MHRCVSPSKEVVSRNFAAVYCLSIFTINKCIPSMFKINEKKKNCIINYYFLLTITSHSLYINQRYRMMHIKKKKNVHKLSEKNIFFFLECSNKHNYTYNMIKYKKCDTLQILPLQLFQNHHPNKCRVLKWVQTKSYACFKSLKEFCTDIFINGIYNSIFRNFPM